jgi:Mce-associated membrane protein
VIIALLAVVTIADGLLWCSNHNASQARTAATAASAAAKNALPVVLSYNYLNLDGYADRALADTTGPFSDNLKNLLQTQVIPAATQRAIVTQTTVQAIATLRAETTTVELLVFIDQTTRTQDNPVPLVQGARLDVTMAKDGDTWRIAGLKPV